MSAYDESFSLFFSAVLCSFTDNVDFAFESQLYFADIGSGSI